MATVESSPVIWYMPARQRADSESRAVTYHASVDGDQADSAAALNPLRLHLVVSRLKDCAPDATFGNKLDAAPPPVSGRKPMSGESRKDG